MSTAQAETQKAYDRYINGWENGWKSALEELRDEWPHLDEEDDDYPSIVDQLTKIGEERVASLRANLRADSPASSEEQSP